MTRYLKSTPYETEQIQARINAGEDPNAVIHRIVITSGIPVLVYEETNDDDDDGYPDGKWVSWLNHYKTVEDALIHAGKCRVGISGVIVTVMVDGKEIR